MKVEDYRSVIIAQYERPTTRRMFGVVLHGQSKADLRNWLFSKLGRVRALALEEDLASQHVNIAITKYRLKNSFTFVLILHNHSHGIFKTPSTHGTVLGIACT